VAAYSELFLEQYADFSTNIDLDNIQGDAINLAGYSVSSQMRKSYYSSTAYDFTVQISEDVRGQILISMDSANTANMSPGRYVYDLNITDENSIVTRVVEGVVIVSPGATR
jgi:hypothetical protein